MLGYRQSAVRDMFNRVLDIMPVEFADLPAGSVAATAAADLQTQYNTVVSESAEQSSFEGTGKEGTALRAVARENIRDYLSTLGRTAKVVSRETPGFDKNYPLVSAMDDTELLNTARAVAPKALADETIFVGRGLTNDFLVSIDGFINDFDASQDTSNIADGSRGASVSDKNTAYESGLDDVDILNDFIRNFYRNQPAKLAAWKIASHIERSPKKKS